MTQARFHNRFISYILVLSFFVTLLMPNSVFAEKQINEACASDAECINTLACYKSTCTNNTTIGIDLNNTVREYRSKLNILTNGVTSLITSIKNTPDIPDKLKDEAKRYASFFNRQKNNIERQLKDYSTRNGNARVTAQSLRDLNLYTPLNMKQPEETLNKIRQILDIKTPETVIKTPEDTGIDARRYAVLANEIAGTKADPAVLIGKFIKLIMQIIGSITLVLFVFSGIMWMTAAGNAEREKKAMNMIFWTSAGVIVILTSYIIVNFIFKNVF